METFNSTRDWRERGYHMLVPPVIIASYDPAADGDDNDALVLTAREEHQKGQPHDPDFAVATKYRVLAGQRMPKALEFPDKLARLLALHRTLTKWEEAERAYAHFFAVEANGVGWGMASALKERVGQGLVLPYTTVGNASEQPYTGGKISMPRLAALNNTRVLAETHHLKIAPDAPGKAELMQELGSFVWRRAGRPEAIEGQKDDLVMALTGGLWIGSKILRPVLKAKRINPRRAA